MNNQTNIDNLQLASNQVRMKAFIIDDFAITFISILILWDKIVATNGDLESMLVIFNSAFVQILFLKFIYQTFFVWYYGATLGKILTKIRVVDYNTLNRVSLLTSATRSVGRLFSEMFFYAGFFLAFYNKSNQTFHDKIAKTLVINISEIN